MIIPMIGSGERTRNQLATRGSNKKKHGILKLQCNSIAGKYSQIPPAQAINFPYLLEIDTMRHKILLPHSEENQ